MARNLFGIRVGDTWHPSLPSQISISVTALTSLSWVQDKQCCGGVQRWRLGGIWGHRRRQLGLMDVPGKNNGWAQRGILGVRVQTTPPFIFPVGSRHPLLQYSPWGSSSVLSEATSSGLGQPSPQPLSGPPSQCWLLVQACQSESITLAAPTPSPGLGGGKEGRRNEGGDKYV